MRVGQKLLRERHRPEVVEPLGDRCPGEHRRFGGWDVPARPAEALDQHVAPLPIKVAVVFDDVLGAV